MAAAYVKVLHGGRGHVRLLEKIKKLGGTVIIQV